MTPGLLRVKLGRRTLIELGELLLTISCLICFDPGVAYTSQCASCNPGTYSDAGSESCIDCPIDTYSEKGARQCIPCNTATEYSGTTPTPTSHINCFPLANEYNCTTLRLASDV